MVKQSPKLKLFKKKKKRDFYYPYLSSSKTTVLSYGPTINSPRFLSSSVGWKVTLYPFTRPGAGSHVTRKLDIVESEVLRFRGGLKGEATRM